MTEHVLPPLLTEERVRNYRNWCAARVGSLSGADIGVALCDAWLASRKPMEGEDGLASVVRSLPVRSNSFENYATLRNAVVAALSPADVPSAGVCGTCGGVTIAVGGCDYEDACICNGTGSVAASDAKETTL